MLLALAVVLLAVAHACVCGVLAVVLLVALYQMTLLLGGDALLMQRQGDLLVQSGKLLNFFVGQAAQSVLSGLVHGGGYSRYRATVTFGAGRGD